MSAAADSERHDPSEPDPMRRVIATRYPAKVLLFGEHAVLAGSEALAMAWPSRHAAWMAGGGDAGGLGAVGLGAAGLAVSPLPTATSLTVVRGLTAQADAAGDEAPAQATQAAQAAQAAASHAALVSFGHWLLQNPRTWSDWLDLAALEAVLLRGEQGPWLASNIPPGYGLGSSGSVCAAVLDAFGRPEARVGEASGEALQRFFARMEGYFHGNSSGVDPLVSFLGSRQPDLALHFGGGQPVTPVASGLGARVSGLQADFPNGWTLTLLNTGLPRQTGPLVAAFQERMREPVFAAAVREELLPANAAAIRGLLEGAGARAAASAGASAAAEAPAAVEPAAGAASAAAFGQALVRIDAFTREYLGFLLEPSGGAGPLPGKPQSPEIPPGALIKLCGAGGGGYLQCWTQTHAQSRP
jgi:hypothetical protein